LSRGQFRTFIKLRLDVPWQQLVDTVDVVLGDALEHMAQVGLGIEPVELGRTQQRVHGRSTVTAFVRTDKQIVFTTQSNRA